jgi:uncharacterized protein (TIGR02453 family)
MSKAMNFQELFNFLRKLQRNNNKEWMDAHRKEYHKIRDSYIGWLNIMNHKLASVDDGYFDTPGKKAINRINNNLLYHPNRPVYKDHFGAGLDQRSKQGDFYIELGVNGSYVGGGYWHPSAKILKSIREAIDFDGESLKQILKDDRFKKRYGSLIEGEELKSAPKGYSPDHEHIDLLRRKSFAASCSFSEAEVCSSEFETLVVESYLDLLPFRRFLNTAVTV